MAVSAGMIAKAAATVLSNEKLRKGVGWTLVAILSPVIVLIALLCSIGSGGADHNNQAVAAAFYGVSYSTEVPAEFRYHIEEMRTAFSLLDSAVASVNGQTESGNGLDPIRIKAVFYALCFGEDAPSARAANRFVECFYTWETRTRTVDIENDDGTVTSTEEEWKNTKILPSLRYLLLFLYIGAYVNCFVEPIWEGALNFFLALCVVDGMVSAMMRRLENDPIPEESVPDTSNLHTDL